MERDARAEHHRRKHVDFNPRAPHGARRDDISSRKFRDLISIHALRMERDVRQDGRRLDDAPISIRALRMERDGSREPLLSVPLISIHALRMERDSRNCCRFGWLELFQSTRSAWSAT